MRSRDDLAGQMMEHLIATKTIECIHHGGPHDLTPMLHVVYLPGLERVTTVGRREQIPAVLAAMRAEAGTSEQYVGWLSDLQVKSVPLSEAVTYGPGDVRARFEEGDMSVREALHVALLDVETRQWGLLECVYTIRDDGMPSFGQIRPPDARPGGWVFRTIEEAVTGR